MICHSCRGITPSKVCEICGRDFAPGEKKVGYQSKTFHEKCFICDECKQPIGTQQFIRREDKRLCGKCYETGYARVSDKTMLYLWHQRKERRMGSFCHFVDQSLPPFPLPPPQKKGPKSRLEVICFDLFGKLELAIGAFLSQDLINNLPCFLLYRFREFGIRLTNYPLIDVLIFYSHHLPASYCISLVRRNSVLVTHGN